MRAYPAWLSVATQELSAMPERATFSFDSVDFPLQRGVVYSSHYSESQPLGTSSSFGVFDNEVPADSLTL